MTAFPPAIETGRFLIRPLDPTDVSDRYLSWLNDENTKRWITSAKDTKQLRELQQYVQERAKRDDVCFLGIFDKKRNLHIGNIKYEPIILSIKCAVMGVLIGDPDYRGRGVFSEVFLSTAKMLNFCYGIQTIYLGVDVANQSAVKAYRSIGFVQVEISNELRQLLGNVTMRYCIVKDVCNDNVSVKCE